MTGNEKFKNGISLRTVHIWLIVMAVVISGAVFYSAYRLTVSSEHLKDATEEHIELEEAALELMNASDYLTEKVQRFTLDGDMQFLNEYFAEAFETNRRENAIGKMAGNPKADAALKRLQLAMDSSKELMNREYYAMRLVIEAKGYTDYPEQLKGITLDSGDAALSTEDKMRRATELVLNNDYYLQKEEIRSNMRESLNALKELTRHIENNELDEFRLKLNLVRGAVLIQVLGILLMVLLTSRLGINPILKAADKIKDDSPIPEMGANEFRYLAQAYNRMYEAYKSSLERLNYKASHDELTGAYNRAGYELLMSGIDLTSTYMLLFDVDDFKTFNDTLGHEVGDRVLIKLVETLKNSFRTDDYICRIGGDEFVVFMCHAEKNQRNLIISKIEQIKRDLKAAEKDLPSITVSVGVVHSSDAMDTADLFDKVDAAMYKSKTQGKDTYTFYAGE